MAHEFKLSEFGLKLIKAYEGFRPVETTLVSGQRVIGFGHKYIAGEEMTVTRKKAEEILKEDLEPYAAMINDSIFAPLTQSQFDALVSLSFNIGPKAFLSSNVLHALNSGHPLEAAAGFDEWRKSVVDNRTYVVDALVRRRTAEKALFLRPTEGVVAAPRNELPPQQDRLHTNDPTGVPVYGRTNSLGVVSRAPYDQLDRAAKNEISERRREDGAAGTLTLSEIVEEGTGFSKPPVNSNMNVESSEILEATSKMLENEEGLSPIAIAAAEVSERLEALISEPSEAEVSARIDQDDVSPTPSNITETTNDLRKTEISAMSANDDEFELVEITAPAAANDGARTDYRRPGRNKASKLSTPDVYIQKSNAQPEKDSSDASAYWAALFIGAALLGGGGVKWFLTPRGQMDDISAFLAPVATIVGGMIVLGVLYYLLKRRARA